MHGGQQLVNCSVLLSGRERGGLADDPAGAGGAGHALALCSSSNLQISWQYMLIDCLAVGHLSSHSLGQETGIIDTQHGHLHLSQFGESSQTDGALPVSVLYYHRWRV